MVVFATLYEIMKQSVNSAIDIVIICLYVANKPAWLDHIFNVTGTTDSETEGVRVANRSYYRRRRKLYCHLSSVICHLVSGFCFE